MMSDDLVPFLEGKGPACLLVAPLLLGKAGYMRETNRAT